MARNAKQKNRESQSGARGGRAPEKSGAARRREQEGRSSTCLILVLAIVGVAAAGVYSVVNPGTRLVFRKEETELPAFQKDNPAKKPGWRDDVTNAYDENIRDLLDTIDAMMYDGHHEKALAEYQRARRQYPDSPRAQWGVAQALDDMSQLQRSMPLVNEAIEEYERTLLKPGVTDSMIRQITERYQNRLMFAGLNAQAVQKFEWFRRRYPEVRHYTTKLGVTHLMSDNIKEGRRILEEVIAEDPENGIANLFLGFVYKNQFDMLNESIDMLRIGIKSGEGLIDGRFHDNLGDALYRVGEIEEAYEVYEQGAQKKLYPSKWQRCATYIPDLRGKPVWKPEETGYANYVKVLEQNWEKIRDEGLKNLDPATGSFQKEVESLTDTGDWKQFVLYFKGQRAEQFCSRAPFTCSLVEKIPPARTCKQGQVKFSVMEPGVHVWPHCGTTNSRLRLHLGLVVPDGPRIRVNSTELKWEAGKAFIFDDSFEHEVWHEGNSTRLVLIVDLWHPDLTAEQRRSLPPL